VIGFTVWVLHETTHTFDVLASFLRSSLADGKRQQPFAEENIAVPFLGESYYIQLVDILYHLFFAFGLYGLGMYIIVRHWVFVCSVQKDLQVQSLTPRSASAFADPAQTYQLDLYTKLEASFYKTVHTHPGYRAVFEDFGCISSSGRLLSRSSTTGIFEFNDYLAQALGSAASNLANIKFIPALVLSMLTLFMFWCAAHLKMQFRHFMEPIGALTVIVLGAVKVVERYVYARVVGEKPQVDPLSWMSITIWCNGIQIMFYALFYSISRIVLSRDMWNNYFWHAVWATVFAVTFLVLLHFLFAGWMHVAVVALSLPPNVKAEKFRIFITNLGQSHESHSLSRYASMHRDASP
jgi:hypothetical protein